jgi:hypothetical protein
MAGAPAASGTSATAAGSSPPGRPQGDARPTSNTPARTTTPEAGPARPGSGAAAAPGGAVPGGRGGGDRRFDPNDPERRARMLERLQQMPEPERAQFLARLKERGITLDAVPAAGSQTSSRQGRAASVPAIAAGGATTIDSLFGPLPTTTTFGRAWLWLSGQKQLKGPMRLRLGISDGQFTELLEGELQEGQELVTAVQIGEQAQGATGRNGGSPLIQQRGPGGPPGGFRGR